MPGQKRPELPTSRPCFGKEELAGVERVFKSRWLGMGAFVEEFENALKEYLGAKNVVAVNTGTSALHIALDSIGIGQGDEVILPSLTFIASVQAVLACGARPIFCDVYPETLTISIEDVQRKFTRRTKAVMPVHFGGSPCAMDDLLSLGRKKGIMVVEDAAHAIGSSYKGMKIGSFGDITCFSFDPIKTVTCGEGGVVATPYEEVARIIRKKRVLGIDREAWRRRGKPAWFYEVGTQGYRYHMSNINAAIGLAQLKKVNEFIRRKRQICKAYDSAFGKIDGITLIKRDYKECGPFFYVIRVKKGRDSLITYLKKHGIAAQVHYIPNHIQPLFKTMSKRLPFTEMLFKEILTLPMFFEMTDSDVERVIKSVRQFFGE